MALGGSHAILLRFGVPEQASVFQRALQAENVDTFLDGSNVGLRIGPWYRRDDLESVALAVTKVAHYLGVRG